MLAQTVGDIIPIAAGVAMSPVPVIAVIVMLFTPQARTNGPAFAAGWVVALLVVGGLTLMFADTSDVSSDESSSDLAYLVRLAIGALFLALALRTWRSRAGEGEEPKMPAWMSAIDTFTPAKAFGMGALLAGVNPKNLGLAVAAGAAIAQAGLDGADPVITLLVFVAIGSVSVAGPVIYYLVVGAAAERALNELKGWLIANNATIMTVVLGLVGCILLGRGMGGLLD